MGDDLNYIEKEAYSHIVVHIASAANKDLKQFGMFYRMALMLLCTL